ncbi:MAG TPA: hypothetical protein VJZ76_00910 [Thermoanaerobaculia bacterium]|nr:hypothetical protein [Thermoanaerobaculia bacterium]
MLARPILIVAALLAPLTAAAQTSLSLYGSGIARRVRIEGTNTSYPVQSWEGGAGVGVERRVGRHFSVELAAERRRDLTTVYNGGRLCGSFHNTCWETRRMEIISKPVVLTMRVPLQVMRRLTVFPSAGVRYVPLPSVHDLTRSGGVPGNWKVTLERRITPEVGAGLAWRAWRRLSFFAERRTLRRAGAAWDPELRTNFGAQLAF